MRGCLLLLPVLLFLAGAAWAAAEESAPAPDPSLYFNFNEGSGIYAVDSSGNGNMGILHGAARADSGVCGRSIFLDGMGSYVEVPYTSWDHPLQGITVSAWFYTASYRPQVLISTYEEGGYRLGFDDGGDLWWTLNLEGSGDVSVPVQHESISLYEWHHVTGSYDGRAVRVYLDGTLMNQVNATGIIHYQYHNYLMLGADPGMYNQTDAACPRYFEGRLDEIRIYGTALTYGQVMDDRFSCPQEPGARSADFFNSSARDFSCGVPQGDVIIGTHGHASWIFSAVNQTEEGRWQVHLAPGSTLVLRARDLYSRTYPDAWYTEISDEDGRVARTVAFPNRNNAPATGIIPSGNATVLVRYFDGPSRFPASVAITLESEEPAPPPPPLPRILNYPIIVIYSASWVTLIAIGLVIIWLHRRRSRRTGADTQPGDG